MGWKSVREVYRIDHAVQVVPEKGICIGSAYIHDILVVDFAGVLVKRDHRSVNSSIARYQEEMDADPERLRALVQQADTFEQSIPVFTYHRDQIIECACEELGWPNVTHDGRMMYENTFSDDRAQVVKWALSNAEARVSNWTDHAEQRQREADDAKAELDAARISLTSLREREGIS